MPKITIELSDDAIAYLKLLDPRGGAEGALTHLAHSAADGLRRPGAWERGWIGQAFSEDDFLTQMQGSRDHLG